MKIRPNPTEMPFNEEDIDNFGLYIDWIPSKLGNKQLKMLQARQLIHENDLYDDDVETETRLNNARPIPIKLQDMTPREKAAYIQGLLDSESESLT